VLTVLSQLLLHCDEGVRLEQKRILEEPLVTFRKVAKLRTIEPRRQAGTGAGKGSAQIRGDSSPPVIENIKNPGCVGRIPLSVNLGNALLRKHDVNRRSLINLKDQSQSVKIIDKARDPIRTIAQRRLHILPNEPPVSHDGLEGRGIKEEATRNVGESCNRLRNNHDGIIEPPQSDTGSFFAA